MKKVLFVALFIGLFSLTAFSDYNKSEVVKVMRNNITLMSAITEAAETRDYFTAAENLMELAQGMEKISDYVPYKGKKAEWDLVFDEFVNTAFKAIGACGEEDPKKLTMYIEELRALNKRGHSQFK